MTNPVLSLQNIRKSYESELVLQDISLDVFEHKATVLIGASGSGKSTILRCINLLADIDDGAIYLDNEEISNPLIDVIRVGDTITVNSNSSVVTSVNTTTQIVTTATKLANGANGLISVSRTFNSVGNVLVIAGIGSQYFPQLTTDDGTVLLTEDGSIILLG